MTDTSLYDYVESSGLIVPDTSTILAEVQQEYRDAFNDQSLIVTPDTPQGVLITAETTSRNSVIQNNAAVANQINPNYAGGVFLDAILALTGGERNVQVPTLVTNVSLTGVAGTVIAVGSQAKTAAGDVFQTTSTITLASDGTGMVNFQSLQFGAIPCAANALNSVISAIIGWETVTNNPSSTPASSTTLGTTTQGDAPARGFRQNTLALNGLSLAEAITSALYNTAGVTSLSFRENFYDVPMGMLIFVTGGTTFAGDIFGMTTIGGTGTDGNIIVGTDAMNFADTEQTLPSINPWPVAAFTTTGNVSLTGLGTQGGGDWPSTMTNGQIVLVQNQSVASQNGLWVVGSGAWTRQGFNVSGSQILPSNDGISMTANSVYSCVDGGTDIDVAAALLENKTSGAGWNGGTTVNTIEPASNQIYPVKFDRPSDVGILIKVTASNVSSAQVTQALLNYMNGTVTDPAGNAANLAGFVVGADVSPFELASAIAIENPGAYVSNVQISLTSPIVYANTPIPIGLNEIAFTQASYITFIQG